MGLLFLNTTGDEEEREQDREENQDSKDSDTTPRSEESSSAVEVSISKGQCKLFSPMFLSSTCYVLMFCFCTSAY